MKRPRVAIPNSNMQNRIQTREAHVQSGELCRICEVSVCVDWRSWRGRREHPLSGQPASPRPSLKIDLL